ncbi:hypothetical protein FGO68_gene8209 [Halteria grandinella]|uniref:Zinc finger C5HC2-type domain-containing protein n=1 Tax=Halteria grandinella TaxID=5974 RepID=A0A8J8P3C3_HALGN|nr:hypothetical protein FGO68_gene8209 [Halteria grandinella]
MSMVHCKHHRINYCINHGLLCSCEPELVKLVYRYSTKELDQFDRQLSELCRSRDIDTPQSSSSQVSRRRHLLSETSSYQSKNEETKEPIEQPPSLHAPYQPSLFKREVINNGRIKKKTLNFTPSSMPSVIVKEQSEMIDE